MEFWGSRIGYPNNISVFQTAHHNNSENGADNDMVDDDDVRAWFPCPFCYVDVELTSLCLHLQQEHCFDFKNAVCPICAANLGKDASRHFTTQHPQSIKRRRKSQKSGLWNHSSMTVSNRELYANHIADPMDCRGGANENAPDPLLSPFLFSNIPLPDPNSNSVDEISCTTSTPSKATSSKLDLFDEAQERDYNERRQRAVFVQQLIWSTMF